MFVPASAMVDARLADADPIGTYMSRQGRRILLIVRRHFENHVELIGLRINRRYLPLAEGIVKRVVDILRRDAQPPGRIAIDIDQQSEAVVLLIARNIAQFGQLFHPSSRRGTHRSSSALSGASSAY